MALFDTNSIRTNLVSDQTWLGLNCHTLCLQCMEGAADSVSLGVFLLIDEIFGKTDSGLDEPDISGVERRVVCGVVTKKDNLLVLLTFPCLH